MKHLLDIVQNPRTLEQSFNSLKDSNINVDENEIRIYLFEYACAVSEIEKIDLNKPENCGFLEFMMRNHCSNIMEDLILYSNGLKISKEYYWYPPSVDKAVNRYLLHPLSTYCPIVFQKAKEQGIFMPNGVENSVSKTA